MASPGRTAPRWGWIAWAVVLVAVLALPGGISSGGHVPGLATGGARLLRTDPATAASPGTVRMYAVTFTESDLPSGALWYVNLSGEPSMSSTASAVSTLLINGTYRYTVGTTDKRYAAEPGSVTVNGANVAVAVTFSPVTFLVTFTETGLPSGTEWYVNVTGTPYLTSSSHTAAAPLPNGSYLYGVGTANHTVYAHGGSFSVDGAPVAVTVAYGPAAKFPVNFTETGLPTGTAWFVSLTGLTTLTSTTDTISTTLYNGSYPFTVSVIGGHWVPLPDAGYFAVAGVPITPTAVGFVYAYVVTVERPAGTPSGTLWSVSLSGLNTLPLLARPSGTASGGSVAPSLAFYEPNGSYTFVVRASADTSYVSTGVFAIDGQNVEVTPSALPPGHLSPYLLYGATVGAAVVVAAAALVLLSRHRPRRPANAGSSSAADNAGPGPPSGAPEAAPAPPSNPPAPPSP